MIQRIYNRSSKTRGFTLIELLVVIAIIGVLAGIVLAALGTTRQKGLVSAVGGNLGGMRTAAELYNAANSNTYVGFCASTGTNGGNRAFVAAAGDVNVTAVGRINVVGAAGSATCIDTPASGTGWAAEVPLPAAITPAGQFWCADGNGFSGTTSASTLTAATDVTCN